MLNKYLLRVFCSLLRHAEKGESGLVPFPGITNGNTGQLLFLFIYVYSLPPVYEVCVLPSF